MDKNLVALLTFPLWMPVVALVWLVLALVAWLALVVWLVLAVVNHRG